MTLFPGQTRDHFLLDAVFDPWFASLTTTFWWLGDGPAHGLGLMWIAACGLVVGLARVGSRLQTLWRAEPEDAEPALPQTETSPTKPKQTSQLQPSQNPPTGGATICCILKSRFFD
ncbi:hypothetical protein APED_13015 [Acanthopleuribacter pedis]